MTRMRRILFATDLSKASAKEIRKPSGSEARTESEKNYLKWVDEIHTAIDKKLVESLKIHENLKYRFMLDLKGYFRFTKERIQTVEQNLDKISAQGAYVYQILDRVYACPPKEWNPTLSELAQLLLDESPVSRFRELRTQITLRMLECLGGKTHKAPKSRGRDSR